MFTMCHWKNNEDILYTTTKVHIIVFYRCVLHIFIFKKMHVWMQLNCIQLYVEQWLLLFVIQNKYTGKHIISQSFLLIFCNNQ